MKVLKIGALAVLSLAFAGCGSSVSGTKVEGSSLVQVALPSGSSLGAGSVNFGTPSLQFTGDSSLQTYQISTTVIAGTDSIPFTFYVSPGSPSDINTMMEGNTAFQVSVECATNSGSFCSEYALLVNVMAGSNTNQLAVLFQNNSGSETQIRGRRYSNYSSVDEALADLQQ